MAGARDVGHLVRTLSRCQIRSAMPTSTGTLRLASNTARANDTKDLSELEQSSSFSTPAGDEKAIDAFNSAPRLGWRDRKLPGERYQYHPPKFDRGPLHPVQSPPSSDPIARNFVPGPFSVPRLKHTYDSTIAPDILTLTYQHTPPGTPSADPNKGRLREWDDSSPYHKNRPARAPRGKHGLRPLQKNITWRTLPHIKGVTVAAYSPSGSKDNEQLHTTRAVLQAITGQFNKMIKVKQQVSAWKIKEGDRAGAKVTLQGNAAYDFVDKLVTLVLPKIKDWEGVRVTTGDGTGNIAFGLKPEWMAYFPELEFNYDMYPSLLIPGCNIYIHTSANSDRTGRLLLSTIGVPFTTQRK